MDLVSSTIERYLKHRFNSTNNIQRQQAQPSSDSQNPKPEEPQIEHQPDETEASRNVANGTTPDETILLGHKELPKIYNLSIINTQPCCIAFRDDLKFIAAGFENSHIHLWKLNHDFNPNNPNTNHHDSKESDSSQHITLLGHSGSIYGIKFIKNDDLMLSCSEDSTIRLWCLKSECNLNIYRGHNYPVWALDVGPKGHLFASCSMDTTARLWILDRMTPSRIFCGHEKDVEVVKFHPNEKYIATGSSDFTVRLWSVSDGLMVRLMVGHDARIISLSFLPDGKFLASASCDGIIKIWDLATNLVSSQLTIPVTYMISFSPELNFVSSCGIDNTFKLCQLVMIDSCGTSKTDDKLIRLIERRDINLNDIYDGDMEKEASQKITQSKLIDAQFNGENKLFVITFQNEDPIPTTNNKILK